MSMRTGYGGGTAASIRYPGWKVTLIAFVSFFFAYGAPVATLPMIYGEVMKEFGWARTEATLIWTYKGVTGTLVTFFVLGPLVERIGLKPVLIIALVAEGLGMAAFSLIHSVWVYYLCGALVGLGQAAVLVGLKLIVSRWFMRNLGLAIGIAVAGTSVGASVFPFVADSLLTLVGWRLTFAAISLGVFLVAIPLCLLANDTPRPEELGIEAAPIRSGGVDADRLKQADADANARPFLAQPAFWAICVAIMLVAAVDQGLYQHTVLYLTGDVGMRRSAAAWVLSITFLVSIAAKFLAGRLFDRLSIKGVAVWYMLVGLAVLLAFPVQGIVTALIFAFMRGVSHGGLVVDSPVIAKHRFGPRKLNQVLPILTGCFTLGSSTGPVLLAMIYDRTGSYSWGFAAFAIAALAAALLLATVRPLYRERLGAV